MNMALWNPPKMIYMSLGFAIHLLEARTMYLTFTGLVQGNIWQPWFSPPTTGVSCRFSHKLNRSSETCVIWLLLIYVKCSGFWGRFPWATIDGSNQLLKLQRLFEPVRFTSGLPPGKRTNISGKSAVFFIGQRLLLKWRHVQQQN